MLLEMEFCEKQTSVIFISLLIIFISNYANGRTIVEEDILIEDDNVVVQTMSYVIRTNTWYSGQIPFNLDPSITKNRDILRNVTTAMYDIQNKTNHCIQFFPRSTSNTNFINISGSDSGCYSSVGRVGGGQIINIGPGCGIEGIIMHELLHALGFWHEHSRNDRDNFVDIKYENIIPGRESDFKKRPDSTGVESVIAYDYLSLLHYKYNQFGRFRRDTIVPNADHRNVDKTVLGQREKLSDKDIDRIMWLYKCDKAPPLASSCAPPDFENVGVEPEQYRYPVGTTVTFKCRKGKRIGAAQSRCLSTGDWSGAKPFCVTVSETEFLYCDMENKQENWSFLILINSAAKWKQFSGPTPTSDTGPDTDHTTQSHDGSYLLFEATGIPANKTAVALSPVLRLSGSESQVCIMFFYYMFGEDLDSTSTLNVFIKWEKVWTRSGSTTERKWYKVVVETNVSNYAFTFITAKRGVNGDDGDKADIAVDDVFLGPCKEVNKYSEVINQAESKEKEYN